jgi:nicotinate-nucleotide--dimethylbenzimidazole phosphoribosyltransferase
MNTVRELALSIHPVSRDQEPAITAHINNLTKPLGSLGRLEEIALRYCLITGTVKPKLGTKVIFTCAGDHGVTAEGVSAFPSAVTAQMVRNMAAGGAAVNVLARHAGAEVVIVDFGVADPLEAVPGLVRRKVVPGTRNLRHEPALTLAQTEQAVLAGAELVREAVRRGAGLIGTGDMGIGNTTSSAALFAALLPCITEEITGRGTGIDDAALARKIAVIKDALARNASALSDPLAALAALGGAEIAGICGLVLGAAAAHVPVVVDGFISSAGALAACRICPAARDYIFYSHRSQEQGHRVFFERFGVEPILDLEMRLGEGTGSALAMPIIEAAVKIYNEMASFASAGVSGKNDAQ